MVWRCSASVVGSLRRGEACPARRCACWRWLWRFFCCEQVLFFFYCFILIFIMLLLLLSLFVVCVFSTPCCTGSLACAALHAKLQFDVEVSPRSQRSAHELTLYVPCTLLHGLLCVAPVGRTCTSRGALAGGAHRSQHAATGALVLLPPHSLDSHMRAFPPPGLSQQCNAQTRRGLARTLISERLSAWRSEGRENAADALEAAQEVEDVTSH